MIAINTGDDQQGITLIARDGRNIWIELTDSLFSNEIGIGIPNRSATYVGTYSLYSIRGTPITVSQSVTSSVGDIQNSGLHPGTYQASQALTVTRRRVEVGRGTAVTDQPVFRSDTLVINGIAIGAALATDDTASLDTSVATASSRAASAIAIAAAINKETNKHGVTAAAEANVLRGTGFTASSASATLNLNNVSITISAYTRNAVIDAINERSGMTGVVALAWGEGIELRAQDGRNIVIASDASAANLGLTNVPIGEVSKGSKVTVSSGVVHYASISLSSNEAFTISRGNEGSTTDDANLEQLGFMVGTYGGKDTGIKVADADISTQLGAQNTITAIDDAMENINSAQARSGAFQKRLDALVNVLQESRENMLGSRSRILDSDYALETAQLAKALIIRQSATAMLSQANQENQVVLALLNQ